MPITGSMVTAIIIKLLLQLQPPLSHLSTVEADDDSTDGPIAGTSGRTTVVSIAGPGGRTVMRTTARTST